MKRPKQLLPQHDYALALQSALSWLGDRYLLAEPVVRRAEPQPPFYVEPTRWHEVRRPSGLARRKH
jgi:hypothetical protein